MHQPMGQGHVIAFAEDANYRAYSEASMLLFMNAVLLGPGTDGSFRETFRLDSVNCMALSISPDSARLTDAHPTVNGHSW